MDQESPSSIEEPDEMATASLSEVLSSRNRFLEESELWALCRECCLTLEYVHDCHDLFQSLCISPDTVAFDPEGNVCFLDLDMEPDQTYVAPESTDYGSNSYKSHLYSLGMTLLFTTEYNSNSVDPRAELSDNLTDLLTALTSDDPKHRPDLDSVIDRSESALGEASSQEICLKIIGLQSEGNGDQEKGQSESTIQQMTDELSAYLQSQSNFVQPKISASSSPSIGTGTPHHSIGSKVPSDQKTFANSAGSNNTNKDLNDNCLSSSQNQSWVRTHKKKERGPQNSITILKDASFDEDDIMSSVGDSDFTTEVKSSRGQKGIMLADVLSSLSRVPDESELWALCRECVLCLQRKKKHLPAYISPDTIMIRETGSVGFKAIPEDKPLEVIYMAPELQQKGILNEKTCLYGLGITLRSATGGKYSTSLCIPDGEALEILIKSFLHGNSDKRPSLETAIEMCAEYEKVNETQSRKQCQKLYQEALKAASGNSSDSHSEYSDEISKANMNSWDEMNSEESKNHLSSDNTHSLAQGDITEAEDNIEDIPYDDCVDDTGSSSSAFRPLRTRDTASINTSAAFKPVPINPKPSKDQYRVPSAFSSPATHFKPIVIHDATPKSSESKQPDHVVSTAVSSSKETDVVAKLREIKHNLLKHRNQEPSSKDVKEINQHSTTSSLPQQKSQPNSNGNTPDLSNALKQLQTQGHLPSTDILASAIAQYLQTHLSGSGADQAVPTTTTSTVVMSTPDNQASHTLSTSFSQLGGHSDISKGIQPAPSLSLPQVHIDPSSVSNHAYLTGQQRTYTISTPATSMNMSTHQVPHSVPAYFPSGQNSGGIIQPLHNQFPGNQHLASNPGPMRLPHGMSVSPYSLSTSDVTPSSMRQPVPISGISATNFPLQYTLVQDPLSGVVQMIPVPFIPVSQPQSAQIVPLIQDASANTLTASGARLYNEDKRSAHASESHHNDEHSQLNCPSNQSETTKNLTEHLHTVASKANTYAANQQTDKNAVGSTHYPKDFNDMEDDKFKPQGERTDSHSSSPSPSKDSGICVTQQLGSLPYNAEPLMERLLSSENSHRQRVLSHVVRILREEYAEDGIFDTGVEDLAIAEYIISLSSLTWETFCSAITEKYFHLVWSYDLLSTLFDVIGGPKPAQHKYSTKTVSSLRSQPFSHRAIDKVERRRRQSEPEVEILNKTQDTEHIQKHHQRLQQQLQNSLPASAGQPGLRPKSEIGQRKSIWSETSDSTDSETRDKRRRFKKRYELDKAKSSSVHNVSLEPVSPAEKDIKSDDSSCFNNPKLLMKGSLNQNNPSVFQKDYIASKIRGNAMTHSQMAARENNQSDTPVKAFPSNNQHVQSPLTSVANSEMSKSSSGFITKQLHDLSTPQSIVQKSSSASKEQDREDSRSENHTQKQPQSPYIAKSDSATRSSRSMISSQLLVRGEHTDSSSSCSPKEQHSLSFGSKQQLSNQGNVRRNPVSSVPHLRDHGNNVSGNGLGQYSPRSDSQILYKESVEASQSKHVDYVSNRLNMQQTPKQNPSAVKYSYTDGGHGHSSDSDFNSSADMRRLAAEKPELFDDRRASGYPTPPERKVNKTLSQDQPFNARHSSPAQSISSEASGRQYNSNYSSSNRRGESISPLSMTSLEHSLSGVRLRRENVADTRPQYGKPVTAMHTREPHDIETAAEPVDNSVVASHHRKAAEESIQFPEISNAVLPYRTWSRVVYHSAMIQLSLTAQVDTFIHSIDEENKNDIEYRLTSIKQEISMEKKQRRKMQTFYRKLNQSIQSGKNPKGEQNVSDQVLKDMTESTRKLSFLQLCETHLQMLLAELRGVDMCFLYALSACEGNGPLTLKSCRDNPYLQFRTISTPHTGQMSVLQAGTPRGLMSYLYTSSALSDGYIHQFLMCFRYILTSEQLLSFILEKYKSAESGIQKDPNLMRVQLRSMDLLLFWLEGYYSIDFAPNNRLQKKLAQFIKEESDRSAAADDLLSLFAACRIGENNELMLTTEIDEDPDAESNYFLHLANPKQWESFRSLLKRSKSHNSRSGSVGNSGRSRSELHLGSEGESQLSSHQFSVSESPAHILAEQLTILEQELFHKCHPVHFLNSQFQGVGVALTLPGMRTPSMTRKSESSQSGKRGLFVGDPAVESHVVRMINHSQELAHWVSAEILSCGSSKTQLNIVTKFLTVAHLCLEVRNFASSLSVLDGLENLVVRQLPIWKNISTKYLGYMDMLKDAKMKLKSETLWLMSQKDCHVYPTIPSALFSSLHLQQVEIGGFTLANGMFKWDKMRSICELVDQMRIFRDHEYGFQPDPDIQKALQRRLSEFSQQDLHVVASTQDNNFRRHSSSSSLSGTLKKVKDKLQSKMK